MAIVLDINILCGKMLDLNLISTLLTKHGVSIGTINSIDSWMWDNEKEVESLEQIAGALEMQQIVIIKLQQAEIKDMGIHIEKFEDQYLYTLWINTEGYPMFDCETITPANCEYYKQIIRAILELNTVIEDSFKVVGIGLETGICYAKEIVDIIRNSKNVMIWMINQYDGLNIQLEKFKCYMLEGVYMLQRK